jgi:hypothetical protein
MTTQRWYDAYPHLVQSLKMFQNFPPQILDIILAGVIEVAENECRVNEIIQSLKTLGTEKVMALHKSKSRRRGYDKNPQLHKTMNYIYVLSESNRKLMAEKMLSLVQFIIEYLKTCQAFQMAPSEEQVGLLTSTFVRRGDTTARQLMAEIREKFEETVRLASSRASSVSAMTPVHKNKGVRLDSNDMRISSR